MANKLPPHYHKIHVHDLPDGNVNVLINSNKPNWQHAKDWSPADRIVAVMLKLLENPAVRAALDPDVSEWTEITSEEGMKKVIEACESAA